MPAAIGNIVMSRIPGNELHGKYVEHVGENCIKQFITYLEEIYCKIHEWEHAFFTRIKAQRNAAEIAAFENATECYLCRQVFMIAEYGDKNCDKNFDHDHLTGLYRGAACDSCNWKMVQSRRSIAVYFHNYRGYDNHHIVHGFADRNKWFLDPIAQNMEKFMAMRAKFPVAENTKGKPIYITVHFRDSCQILNESLASLVKNVGRKFLTQTFKMQEIYNVSEDVIKAKGIFPYSFFDNYYKMKYPRLPSFDAFYDYLREDNISTADYEMAGRAWKEFKCKNLGDYMLRYLEMDVRQLCDVFEYFRQTTRREDGLDGAHFLTVSQFAMSAALKRVNKTISLCPTPEMYRFFERSIRGGIAFCNSHCVTASKPNGQATDNDLSIMYVDENNLYGAALSMKLPVSNFEMCEDHIDWATIDTEGNTGYLLEVDLEYPPEIHDRTQHFPLAAENLDLTHAMITPEMVTQLRLFNVARNNNPDTEMKTCKKLVATCANKYHYVVHFKVLQFYLRQGLRILTIHQVVSFHQEAIYKDYIDFNSGRRALSTNEFDKSYYKQKNNSLFGKSMEDTRNRMKVKLIGDAFSYAHHATKPTFLGSVILAPDLTIIKHTNANVSLKSTIAIGAVVLDLSKVIMYDLVYCKLPQYEEKFNCKMTVCGGDTDSLFISVRGKVDLQKELYPAMIRDKLLDTSNYPKNHILYSDALNAQLGCIKDEFKGAVCSEIIMLAPKCYSMAVEGGDKRKAKGVGRRVTATLTHDDYKQRYLTRTELVKNVKRMQSFNHVIFNITQAKVALSFMDNKRAWLSANDSLPYGHYKLN